MLAGILVIMLKMNWRLALITFAVLPFIFYRDHVFRRNVRDSYRRIRVAIARINSYLQEHVSGMVVLQLFNREKRAYKEFRRDQPHAHGRVQGRDSAPTRSTIRSLKFCRRSPSPCVIWFGGNRRLRNVVTLGVLVAFMQYAQRFFRPIQDLSEKYNILQSAMASSERIFKLLDTPAEIVSPASSQDSRRSRPHRVRPRVVRLSHRAQADREAASKGEKLEPLASGVDTAPNSTGS